jgi:hypothetical protein
LISKKRLKNIFETRRWKNAERITILSRNHLNKLLSQRFEIQGIGWAWTPNKTDIRLRLASKKKRLVGDAIRIGEYVLHLQELYDFKHGKPRFTWVPDTSIYRNFEVKLTQMLTGEFKRHFLKRKNDSYYRESIFDKMCDWVTSNKGRTSPESMLSRLFSQVCIVNEYENEIYLTEISKEAFNATTLSEILNAGKSLKSSIALSFFYLTRKIGQVEPNDFVVGLIAYDLKKRIVLCFNFKSLETMVISGLIPNISNDFYDIALSLFRESVDRDEFKSFLPLPLDSPWYTALPWFSYTLLVDSNSQYSLETNNTGNGTTINITELFTFGTQSNPLYGNTFDFKSFSLRGDGYATCIFNIQDKGKKLVYTVRYDQSKGQPLVHLDYSLYNQKNEHKLVNHKPLDLEAVYNFSEDLYIAITAAGLFDGYFTTCIRKGLKGADKLFKKNPAFLYSLTIVYKLDTYVAWLTIIVTVMWSLISYFITSHLQKWKNASSKK